MQQEEAVEVLKALSDPTRLRILALLRRNPILCVCELEAILGLPQYTVSRHMAVLRHAGLVRPSRDGARVNYALRQGHGLAFGLLVAATEAVADDPQFVADRQAARDVRAVC